jgi:hypothetical protein
MTNLYNIGYLAANGTHAAIPIAAKLASHSWFRVARAFR